MFPAEERVKQVLCGISHFFLPTNQGASCFTDEETHDGLTGEWASENPRIGICKNFSSRRPLTDDSQMVDVFSGVHL